MKGSAVRIRASAFRPSRSFRSGLRDTSLVMKGSAVRIRASAFRPSRSFRSGLRDTALVMKGSAVRIRASAFRPSRSFRSGLRDTATRNEGVGGSNPRAGLTRIQVRAFSHGNRSDDCNDHLPGVWRPDDRKDAGKRMPVLLHVSVLRGPAQAAPRRLLRLLLVLGPTLPAEADRRARLLAP